MRIESEAKRSEAWGEVRQGGAPWGEKEEEGRLVLSIAKHLRDVLGCVWVSGVRVCVVHE